MASTNKTSHYNLSQYVGTDKPTYLVDYNTDMSNIDTGIYNAQSEATTNTASIGTLSSLTTTAQTDLVSAINEVDGNVDTLSGTVAGQTIDIASNTSAIGNLTNLDTTAKNNLVAAINEVNTTASEINKLNLTTFTTYSASDMTGLNGTYVDNGSITIAKNSDGSVAKIYGYLVASNNGNRVAISISNTGLTPDSEITIAPAGITITGGASGMCSLVISTNGNLELRGTVSNASQQLWYMPCLYFIKDFGDQD